MTEEEYFRKNYPDSCYGDKPLSPHWDFFQDGVEFGERDSEKRIEELEKENAELKEYNKYLRRQRQGGIKKQYNKVAIIKQQDEQLTKAKELLKRYVPYRQITDSKAYKDLADETEQFLKELDNDKEKRA